ncbi:MAG: thioredoxin family protein [Elusimicrobiales bacterium]
MVTVLTEDNFEAEVLKSEEPVLVAFWAPGCAPCLITGRILDDLAAEPGNGLRIAKLDVAANPAAAARFDIGSVPYLALFSGGRPVRGLPGPVPAAILKLEAARALGAGQTARVAPSAPDPEGAMRKL